MKRQRHQAHEEEHSLPYQALAAALKSLHADGDAARGFKGAAGASSGAAAPPKLNPAFYCRATAAEDDNVDAVGLIQKYVDCFAQMLVDKSLQSAETRERKAKQEGKGKLAKARAVQIADVHFALENEPLLLRIKKRVDEVAAEIGPVGRTGSKTRTRIPAEGGGCSAGLACTDALFYDCGTHNPLFYERSQPTSSSLQRGEPGQSG